MVRQAVRQTYTYYERDGSARIIKDAELKGRGKTWTLGAYEPPWYPSPLNVRVGNAGIKVWMVINWLQSCGGDVDTLLKRHAGVLEREDVEVAKWYYEENKDIDREFQDAALGA